MLDGILSNRKQALYQITSYLDTLYKPVDALVMFDQNSVCMETLGSFLFLVLYESRLVVKSVVGVCGCIHLESLFPLYKKLAMFADVLCSLEKVVMDNLRSMKSGC